LQVIKSETIYPCPFSNSNIWNTRLLGAIVVFTSTNDDILKRI